MKTQQHTASHAPLARREVVAALLRDRGDTLVVTGLGSPAYDVHAAGDNDANFYLWGAMGGAALVGLGLAQAQPGRPVLVVTGDGEQLMGLGGLATIAAARPRNLSVVVIDNQHFGETGMQASHTGRGVDLAGVAAACGFASAVTVTDAAGLQSLCEDLARPAEGPRLAVVKVAPLNPPRSLPMRDAVALKTRFRATLGLPPS
ncbi:thiamine pyrophosphate-dependent enzyme [Alsobacter sp. R-9]